MTEQYGPLSIATDILTGTELGAGSALVSHWRQSSDPGHCRSHARLSAHSLLGPLSPTATAISAL